MTHKSSPLAILYHGDDAALHGLTDALASERIELRGPEHLISNEVSPDLAAVLLLDHSLIERTTRPADMLAALPEHLVIVAADESVAEAVRSDRVALTLPSTNPDAQLRVLRAAYQLSAARINAGRAERERADESLLGAARARAAQAADDDAAPARFNLNPRLTRCS